MKTCRSNPRKKVCSKCKTPKHPVKDFYHRPDTGGRMNVCKACCVRAAVKRSQDKRKNADKIKPGLCCTHEGEPLLHCNKCNDDKPQCNFIERPDRPGKYYKTCKACKASKEKQRRASKPLKPELFTFELFENEDAA